MCYTHNYILYTHCTIQCSIHCIKHCTITYTVVNHLLYHCTKPWYWYSSRTVTVLLLPVQFYSPDIITRCLLILPDSFALLLVLIPASRLAGAITVVGKLALGTAEQLSLATETAVAHLAGKTVRGDKHMGSL